MKVKVQSFAGKSGGDIELNDAVFGVEPRADILHRVVTWQLEKRRGTARAARERSDVARTGKKYGKQKGGGTARHGDRRAPIFIGGGKAHGPRVRDFNPSLNKKVRALGLKMALSTKARDGKLIVICDEHDDAMKKLADEVIEVPWTIEPLQPILTVVPTQLLAYYIALRRGADVDQPRNLAKSVTVE